LLKRFDTAIYRGFNFTATISDSTGWVDACSFDGLALKTKEVKRRDGRKALELVI
jgi:hypothetical protein